MATPRRKQAKLFPKAMVTMSLESNLKEGLQRLEQAVQEKVTRPAAYAGARILYDEMRLKVPTDEGDLYGSIYHWFDDKRSTLERKIYAIGPNKAKAPHWHLVEYGHYRVNKVFRDGGRWKASKERLPEPKWVPAYPYIRPTWDGMSSTAMTAMKTRMSEKMREVMREIGKS